MKLVFETWKKDGKDVYSDYPELTLGPFHAGSTFDCKIAMSPREKKQLDEALEDGFTPVFEAISDD